jgi:hypothetical protein
MKKWDTPVLSVLRRSTSAEKVLVICKHVVYGGPMTPSFYYGGYCFKLNTTPCISCQGITLS